MNKDQRPDRLAIGRALGCGFSKCPRCDSNHWKSAKMVVLKGTHLSEGELSGSVRKPGALTGGVRALLLSDYCFTREYSLNLNIELITRSALVDEVKRFMVECWSALPTSVESQN
jgi:hypothetical protein